MRATTLLSRAAGLIGLLVPIWAQAHTGADAGAHHGLGFVEGLVHPFTGFDHLAAMLAVGAWSALVMRGRQVWTAPLAFAATLLAGAVLGAAGVAVPAVEPMIAASLLVLGLLVATRRALAPALGAALVGGFALFHGVAHGAELAASASMAAALAGMVSGTVALHLAGVGLGRLLQSRSVWLTRIAGGGVAVLGMTLLVPAVAQVL